MGSSSLLYIQSHGARIVLLRHEGFKTIQCINKTRRQKHIFAMMELEEIRANCEKTLFYIIIIFGALNACDLGICLFLVCIALLFVLRLSNGSSLRRPDYVQRVE